MAVSAPRSPARSPMLNYSPSVKRKAQTITRTNTTGSAGTEPKRRDQDGEPGGGEGSSASACNFDTRSETSSVKSIDRLAELIRWVPGSNQELFDAEDKLLSFVNAPHELVHVSIGPAPDVQALVARSLESETAIQKRIPGGLVSLVPSVSAMLPKFSVASAARLIDGVAQGVGLSGRHSMDDNGNCYINTLLVGDVAEVFADMHRQNSVGDLASLAGMEGSKEGDAEGDAKMRGEKAASTPKAHVSEPRKLTMSQRFWASLSPFAKTIPKLPSFGSGPDDPEVGLDADPNSRPDSQENMHSEDRGKAADAEGARPEEEGGDASQRGESGEQSQGPFMNEAGVGGPGSESPAGDGEPRVAKKRDLVMVHGYAACIGFFFRNFEMLSQHFNIYAIDQLGWGASSRPSFTPESAEEAETWFVEALELWRQEVGLKKFVLLGHSFGGFISAKYALKYPQHVEHLLLVGPAGFNHVSPKMQKFRQTWKGHLLGMLWETNLTPQLMLKFLGPWSEDFVKRAVTQRWSNLPPGQEDMPAEQVKAFSEYIFQSLLAPMSGELCMKHVFSLGAFARRPLIDCAPSWKVPTTFIYGQDDIMDYRAGLGAAKLMPVPAEVLLVTEAGHMLFLEKPTIFNHAVLYGCRELLEPGLSVVDVATKAVAPYLIPLTQCHGIPAEGDSDSLFASQGPGRGMVRLASGWGIG